MPYVAFFTLKIFSHSISDAMGTCECRKGIERKDAKHSRVAEMLQTNSWLERMFSAGLSSAPGAGEAGWESTLVREPGAREVTACQNRSTIHFNNHLAQSENQPTRPT